MPKLRRFDLPAFQADIKDDPNKAEALAQQWSDDLSRFAQKTLQNNAWSAVNQPGLTDYYNPLTTEIPEGTKSAGIGWTAFPRRIQTTFPNVGQRTQWEYADQGPPGNYSPQGPRGWQDEYCEWSVTRNGQGKITKVSFTCENREYWYSLWRVSPETVLRLYHELVGDHVKLEDLYLRDDNGLPIIDRSTGQPAYDDRNQWNSTTHAGAVHLISNPNSLFAEIFLAGQATVLREDAEGRPITDPNNLINCSRYGTPNRNSDPHIGASVNGLVRGASGAGSGVRVSLANPVGLYIQTPNFQSFQLPFTAPQGAQASDYWKVVRGRVGEEGDAIDLILHAVYEVPEDHGFTVGDILIDGFNIDYGSQITQKFQVALAGAPVDQEAAPSSYPCAGSSTNPLPQAATLADANTLSVAFRSSAVMYIEQGKTVENAVLYATDASREASIEFTDGDGVSVEKTGFQAGQGAQLFTLTITVEPDATPGNRSILIKNPNGAHGPAAFGMLEIVASSADSVADVPGAVECSALGEARTLVPNLATVHECARETNRNQT